MPRSEYTAVERWMLSSFAMFGLFGINGAFLYGVSTPELFWTALGNPISLAFMIEALLMVALLAYLLTKWKVTTLRWPWFVLLSLLGSLAFALPVVLLYGGRKRSLSEAGR